MDSHISVIASAAKQSSVRAMAEDLRASGPLAGGSPAASHFLLHGQEKVTKEKAALLRHPFGAGLD
jgi:hypothetical protein